MQNAFGVFRDKKSMERGLFELERVVDNVGMVGLRDRSKIFNLSRVEALEFFNIAETALATARSACLRTESRGAHCRYDYKERDDINWLKHTLCYKDGTIKYKKVNFSPINTSPCELQERK